MASVLTALVESGDSIGVQKHIRALQEQGVNVAQEVTSHEFGDRGSRSALHVATIRGHVEILEYLLATGADPNATDEAGATPLHFAAEMGRARAARALLQAGAAPDRPNAFGSKPIDKVKTNSWDLANVIQGKADIWAMFEGGAVECDDVPPESPVSIPKPAVSALKRGGASAM